MALKTNLHSHIEFEETSGNFLDSVGAAEFIRRGGATHATGKLGNSLTLASASSQFVDYADDTDWSPGDQDFAFGAWVRLDSTGSSQAIVSKYFTTGDQREYLLGVNSDDEVYWSVSATGTSTVTTLTASTFGALSSGTWYYVFAYHDSVNNVIGISVNGSTRETAAHTTGVHQGTSDICIGRFENGLWYLDGDIDEVSYWEGRVPSTADVDDIYNSGSGLAYADWDATPANATLVSATIPSAGDTITIVYSGNVTATDATGLILDSDYGRLTLTNLSGDGTDTHTYDLQRTIYDAETLTLTFESAYDATANVTAFSDESVTNNSTQTEADFVYVNASTGDDANDGTTTGQAVETITRALSLYNSNLNSGAILFNRGDTWDCSGVTWNFGQGSGARPLCRVGAYGTGDRPVIESIKFSNVGSGLYNCTISDIVFTGDGITEADELFRLTKVVGDGNVVHWRNVKMTGYKNAINITPYLTGLPLAVLTDCEISNHWSIGALFQEMGGVTVENCTVTRNAFGTTPDTRTHNDKTHGIYIDSCHFARVIGNAFNDNGSQGAKIGSDYTDRVQPCIVVDNVFIDGFFGLGLDASDVADIGAGNVRHRDVWVAGNAFVRTRDTSTGRRVDTGDITRDYWDRLMWFHAVGDAIVKHNVVQGPASGVADNPNSVADNFVFLETDQYHENVQIGSDYLVEVAAEYNDEATTLTEADTRDPVLMTALITQEGDELWLVFNRPITGQTAFSVTASGGAVTLSSPSGDTTAVHRHALSRSVLFDETFTLSYDSGTGTSVDDDATAVASITDQVGVNNSFVGDIDLSGLRSGLQSHYRLEEASGTRSDSYQSNDLTPVNTPGNATGKVGSALSLTAASSHRLEAADSTVHDLSGSWHFAAWVYCASSTGSDQTILSKYGAAGDRQFTIERRDSSGEIRLIVSSDGTATAVETSSSYGSVPLATWVFVEAWHDADNDLIGVAVNRTADTTAHATGVFNGGTDKFTVGCRTLGNYWNGRIDELSIWDRVLTSDESDYLYNSGSGRDWSVWGGSPPAAVVGRSSPLMLIGVG